jgi:predicted AAA+ superfamily ATPase
MAQIERALFPLLKSKVQPGKVLVLLGARRTGKTALLHKYAQTLALGTYEFLNGEDQATVDLLASKTAPNYARLVAGKTHLILDEAQNVPDIGAKLKFLVDTFPELIVIATGSSVFDLSQRVGEPLVGRQKILRLYPLAQMEFKNHETLSETYAKREERLIYGGYPELEQYPNWQDKKEYLETIVNDYLLRDVLVFDGLRKADKLLDILRLIALQIGKEVSIDELANGVKGITRNTLERYLDILEKVFVIYRVGGFSRNLRKEVVKSHRWYFFDNGIRNAIIRNTSPLALRGDDGALWENYLMAERQKFHAYSQHNCTSYFWRTYDKQEIDLVEEANGKLAAYEFKWNPKKLAKAPGGWQSAYPMATFTNINPDNYLEFIGG